MVGWRFHHLLRQRGCNTSLGRGLTTKNNRKASGDEVKIIMVFWWVFWFFFFNEQ
jgi:hypothetical protein